jgi:hypothetical protein
MMGNLVPQQGKESIEGRIEPNNGQSGAVGLLCMYERLKVLPQGFSAETVS